MKKVRWIIVASGLTVGLVFITLRSRHAAPAAELPVKKDALALTAAALENNPVATAHAKKTRLAADLDIVGSVSWDQDHYAVVGPLVAGRVARLRAGLGDV